MYKLNSNYRFPIESFGNDTGVVIPAKAGIHKFQQNCFILNFGFWIYFVIGILSFVIKPVYAKDITILYTGDTHAMLYPCNCPLEPDGGIARRATLVNQLRRAAPDLLLLDSGSFFAGGQLDEYTQNDALDKARTRINIQAMNLMRYDAVCAGDDEFNFGRDFLEESAAKSGFAFLSANIKSVNLKPFVLKEVKGVKIAIIGLTGRRAISKAAGLEFIEPITALKTTIEAAKKQGAAIIVVLSRLGIEEDAQLLRQAPEVNVLISEYARQNAAALEKSGAAIILRPAWEGRHLGKVTLKLKDNRIIDAVGDDIRLSDKLGNDPKMLSILPRCFRDSDCKQQGAVGVCLNPGELKAQCQFSPANKVNLLVILPEKCIACSSSGLVNQLKNIFPGLDVSYLYYPAQKAKKIAQELKLKDLPAYLFAREVEQDKKFPELKERFELRGNYYLIKPQYSGISFFLERKKIKGKLDLFISLFNKDAAAVLEGVKNLRPDVHFLVSENRGIFEAAGGSPETEESLRAVSVAKYYPEKFWDYLRCRAKDINSTWWEDCLTAQQSAKISAVSRSQEAKELLKENIRLNKEVQVMFGPTYLVDNQEIFGTQGPVTEKELRRTLRR